MIATKSAEGMPATPIEVSRAISTTVAWVTQPISMPKSWARNTTTTHSKGCTVHVHGAPRQVKLLTF